MKYGLKIIFGPEVLGKDQICPRSFFGSYLPLKFTKWIRFTLTAYMYCHLIVHVTSHATSSSSSFNPPLPLPSTTAPLV